jgi:hypothetical protein
MKKFLEEVPIFLVGTYIIIIIMVPYVFCSQDLDEKFVKKGILSSCGHIAHTLIIVVL